MKKPNVIVIMTDQQKADAMRLYGNADVVTPNLERMAAEGILYNHAFTPHPLCVPARIALWTSRYPHNNGCRRNETFMKEDAHHAFKVWKEEGYVTGLIGKNHCFGRTDYERYFDTWLTLNHTGLDKSYPYKGSWFRPEDGIARAYEELKSIPHDDSHLAAVLSDGDPEDHSTGVTGGQAVRFIEEHRDRPFALWVSFPCPHEPYVVPRKYAERVRPEAITLPPFDESSLAAMPSRTRRLYRMFNAKGRETELRNVMRVYYANILYIDEMVGAILDKLDEAGLSDDTIVVFTSDHGDFCGAYNMTVKGGIFHDSLVKVPLLMRWSGHLPCGRREESIVNLVDLVPTLLHLQGIPVSGSFRGKLMRPVDGSAFSDMTVSEYGCGFPLLDDASFERFESGDVRRYGMAIRTLRWREAEGRRKMVRTRDWKFVHDPMGDIDELYDMRNDPHELRNLAQDPDYAPVMSGMMKRLMQWSVMTEDAIDVPTDDILPEFSVST